MSVGGRHLVEVTEPPSRAVPATEASVDHVGGLVQIPGPMHSVADDNGVGGRGAWGQPSETEPHAAVSTGADSRGLHCQSFSEPGIGTPR